MSVRFNHCAVDLDFFYQTLGSKNESLVQKAFLYLDTNILPFGDDLSADTDFCRDFLHGIVFDGVVGDYTIDQSFFAEGSLKAIFSQGKGFHEYGGGRSRYYWDIFLELEANSVLDEQEQKIWKYILEGRNFGETLERDENDFLPRYYAYLTKWEVATILKTLSFLKIKSTQDFLEEIQIQAKKHRPVAVPKLADVALFQKILEDIVDKHLDYFVDVG